MHSKEFSIKFLTLLLSNRYIPGYEVESIDNDGKLDKNGLETYVAINHEIATDMYFKVIYKMNTLDCNDELHFIDVAGKVVCQRVVPEVEQYEEN